jgi:ketosteroid isomerase-like protein
MAHPNEELVRRGYEAFNNADVETLREVFADTTIFHEPGRSPISGDYRRVRSPTVLVFHVRDGRVAETWSHHYDQHEFDEFWA